jgi:hypothetical protein
MLLLLPLLLSHSRTVILLRLLLLYRLLLLRTIVNSLLQQLPLDISNVDTGERKVSDKS